MARRIVGIDREDVKAAIRKRGVTLEQLSVRWGYRENAISLTLGRPWPAVQQRVAAFLGYEHPREIWPARYYDDGTPKPRAAAKKAETKRKVGRAA